MDGAIRPLDQEVAVLLPNFILSLAVENPDIADMTPDQAAAMPYEGFMRWAWRRMDPDSGYTTLCVVVGLEEKKHLCGCGETHIMEDRRGKHVARIFFAFLQCCDPEAKLTLLRELERITKEKGIKLLMAELPHTEIAGLALLRDCGFSQNHVVPNRYLGPNGHFQDQVCCLKWIGDEPAG